MEHTSNKTSGGSMKNRHSATLIRMQEFFRAVQEQLEQEWTSFHTFKSCPVFFNITNFHLFNAAYGIEKGDACLQHIAMLLQQHFPKNASRTLARTILPYSPILPMSKFPYAEARHDVSAPVHQEKPHHPHSHHPHGQGARHPHSGRRHRDEGTG